MPYTQKTIGTFFEEQVARLPEHEFIVYPDRDLRWTYSEFNQRVDDLASQDSLAKRLQRLGKVADRVRSLRQW